MKLSQERTQMLLSALIPQFIILSVSILWILIFPKDNVIDYYKTNAMNVLIGILAGIVLAFLGYGYYLMAKKIKALYDSVELFEKILVPIYSKTHIVDIFILSCAAAFCEETFFRGLLSVKIGIFFSSIAFGLLHLPGKKYWIYAVWAGASGAFFAYLFNLSGTLWLPITAHAVNNITGMLLLKKVKNTI